MNKLFMLSSGVYQFEEMHQWIRPPINSKLIQLHMLINMCGFCSPVRTDKPDAAFVQAWWQLWLYNF